MALSGSKSYTLTIGNGPLAITVGTNIPPLVLMRQVMRKLPGIKSFSIPRLARQPLSDLQLVSVLVSSVSSSSTHYF